MWVCPIDRDGREIIHVFTEGEIKLDRDTGRNGYYTLTAPMLWIVEGGTVDEDEPVAEEADVDLTDDENGIADEPVFDDEDEPAKRITICRSGPTDVKRGGLG